MIGALLITFFVSTYEFTGISSFLGPILDIQLSRIDPVNFFEYCFLFDEF